MKFFNFPAPLLISFSRNPQLKDVMVGVICSKVERVLAPVGKPRDLLDEQLHGMAAYNFLADIHHIPAFSRQQEILDTLFVTTPGLIGRNEQIIRQSTTGQPFNLTSMFDVINIYETFHTLYSYDSFDLNKINSTGLMYRAGFHHEYYEQQGRNVSMNLVPVLGTIDKMIGSPYGWFNNAPVDFKTREIVTVVFALGVTMEDYQSFARNLRMLKKRQEQDARTVTTSIKIVTGYPSVYVNDWRDTPLLVVDSAKDKRREQRDDPFNQQLSP